MKKIGFIHGITFIYFVKKNLEVKSALLLPLPSPPLPNILLGSLELTNTPPPPLDGKRNTTG